MGLLSLFSSNNSDGQRIIFPYEITHTQDLHKKLRSPISDLIPYVSRENVVVTWQRNKIVIIGDPGTGKTREAMEIIRQLDHDRKSVILLSSEGVHVPTMLPDEVKNADQVILFVDDFSRRQADASYTKELQEQASSFSDETTRLKKTIAFFEEECELENFYVITTILTEELKYLRRVGTDVNVLEQFERVELTLLRREEVMKLIENLAIHFDGMEVDAHAREKLVEFSNGTFSPMVRFFSLKHDKGRYRITTADADEFRNMQETVWEEVYFRSDFWERRIIETLSILRQCAVEPFEYIVKELCEKMVVGIHPKKKRKIANGLNSLIEQKVVTTSGNRLLCYDLFLKDKGNLEEYIDEVTEILIKYSKDENKQREIYASLFNLAVRLYYRNKSELCSEVNNRIMEINPTYASAHYDLGVLLYDLKKYEEAEEEYKRMMEKYPDDAEPYFNWGTFSYNRHDYEEAEDAFKKAIELSPEYPEAHFRLGLLYHRLGKDQLAEEEYRTAIQQNPFDAKFRNTYGLFLKSRNRYYKAEHEYKQAIQIDPGFASAYHNYGVLLVAMGRAYEAAKAYRKSLELDPDNAKAHHNYGILLKNMGFAQEAEKEFQRAIQLDPDFGKAYNSLGALLLDQNRLDEAGKAFEQAIELNNLVTAHYNLTLLYDNRGESEKSIEHWEAILGINE